MHWQTLKPWSNTVTYLNCKNNRLLRSGHITLLLLATTLLPVELRAGEADVINVDASCNSERICRFDVTLKHADAGWDHYADKWDVVTPDGTLLGTRVLLHPHVNEQPFTRSLGNVRIPDGISHVVIRAHDSQHGYGGKTYNADISG
jgi:hypothetical protein